MPQLHRIATFKRKPPLRGVAAPALVREPLFVRFCAAFVNNLTLLLRTAFVLGSIFLIRDLRGITDEWAQSEPQAEPSAVVQIVETEPPELPESQDTELSERVQHFLNCTYDEYRTANFDECVEGPSRVYTSPQANPDDTGHIIDPDRNPATFAAIQTALAANAGG